MPEHTTGTAEQQAYQQHHRDEAYWTPQPQSSSIEIISTQPPNDPDFPPVFRGRFQKGYDARRHVFTQAERSKGFWTAIAVMGVGIGDKLHRSGKWPTYRGKH